MGVPAETGLFLQIHSYQDSCPEGRNPYADFFRKNYYLQTSTQPMAPDSSSSSFTVSFTALWSSPAAG